MLEAAGVFPVNCPRLTLSVEFTLKVKLAVNGPNILTSFCGVKKTILWVRRQKMFFYTAIIDMVK